MRKKSLIIVAVLWSCGVAFADTADPDEIPDTKVMTIKEAVAQVKEKAGVVTSVEYDDNQWTVTKVVDAIEIEYHVNPTSKAVTKGDEETSDDPVPPAGQIDKVLNDAAIKGKNVNEVEYEGNNRWEIQYIGTNNQEIKKVITIK